MSFITKTGTTIRSILMVLISSSALVWLPANAAMVGTNDVLGTQKVESIALPQIGQIRTTLSKQLQDAGVSAIDAQQRVDLLTDQQVVEIQQRFDETPAGAGAGGVLVAVLLVLLITDLVGYTDVFPFVRPLER